MAGKTDRKGEIGKNWTAPELRKISIEQITANGTLTKPSDGGTSPNNHQS